MRSKRGYKTPISELRGQPNERTNSLPDKPIFSHLFHGRGDEKTHNEKISRLYSLAFLNTQEKQAMETRID